ncbi:protein LAX PANICLE 2-like isoform X2 [Miscanthus floridulus]|uniref:protein LAX PANICLE 2-like isoform X2 n=1 Tax=Miscanthus floridulus TaxID=154761 RepID=UPI00345B1679
MVTLLRPHRHAHGPAAVSVRLISRSHSQQHHQLPPTTPSPCRRRSVVLRPMAQDPSHPHRQSKDTAAPPQQQQQQQQQPEQPEIVVHQPEPQPQPPRDVQEAAAASSSSSSGSDAGSSWLQLGIGPSSASPPPSPGPHRKRHRPDDDAAGPSTSVQPASALPLLPQLQLSLQPGPSSSSSAAPVGTVVAAAPPPPSHDAGTWFLLRAAQNQRMDPPLPQIPRSYLRVRDGRMTVRVVMRYLVNKLGLDDDSQLEITCRGQRLQPTMTLQQVRDTIWRPVPAEAAAVLPAPGSPSTNQIMTLHYGRS